MIYLHYITVLGGKCMAKMDMYYCEKCLHEHKNEFHGFQEYLDSLWDYGTIENDKKYYKGIGAESKNINGNCICCGSHLIKLNLNQHELTIITDCASPDPDYVLSMCKMKREDINKYNVELKELEIRWKELLKKKYGDHEDKQDISNFTKLSLFCPRCGSTNIKTERRKYGLFDWFTNSSKICHTCDECDYTWMEI